MSKNFGMSMFDHSKGGADVRVNRQETNWHNRHSIRLSDWPDVVSQPRHSRCAGA